MLCFLAPPNILRPHRGLASVLGVTRIPAILMLRDNQTRDGGLFKCLLRAVSALAQLAAAFSFSKSLTFSSSCRSRSFG